MLSGTGQFQAQEQFLLHGDAPSVLASRSAAVDGLVTRAFQDHLAPCFPQGMAVLAVGGFGRRELFPHSDVDLLLLVREEPRLGAGRDALAAFLRTLWDQGLRLGHSVRTVTECCSVNDRNIELSISLLDQRLLAGDETLYGELSAALPRFFYARRQELMNHLCRLTRVRHARYANTIHHLEPNVKETPGGLRDLQLVRWLSQLRTSQPYLMPVSESFPELDSARNFLSVLRCFLHIRAGRDSNLLTFDAQEEIARLPFIGATHAADWMREYYLRAREVYRAASHWMEVSEPNGSALLSQFRDWRSRVSNAEFTVSRERVFVRKPGQIAEDAEYVKRLFLFIARHGILPSADTKRRVLDNLPALTKLLAEGKGCWPFFKELLGLPHAGLALEAMHETGVLSAVLPEWAGIDCLVISDYYHRYTVDAHTLAAIGLLGDLAGATDAIRQRFAAMFEEVESKPLLLAAALMHDLGKAVRSGNHVPESARLAEAALTRLGAAAEERRVVCFLISRHMDLSAALGSRDLDDPAIAAALASRCASEERLKELTLLTYADVSAVHPSAMTPWRLEQLWRAYLVTHEELTRELDADRIEAPEAAFPPELAAFLEGFPSRYLRTHTEEQMQAHLELHKRAAQNGVAVDIRKQNGTYALVVAAADRPSLLSAISGALAGFGMNILKAEAFANRRGMILDSFVFEDPNRTLELNPPEMDRLRLTLERVVLGKIDVKRLLQNRPKPPVSRHRPVRPSVTFNSDASPKATLIEVVSQDRPGLLYDLTSAISAAGANIEVVLIDTEAHRALDVFYVTAGGGKLSAEQETALREKLLKACGA